MTKEIVKAGTCSNSSCRTGSDRIRVNMNMCSFIHGNTLQSLFLPVSLWEVYSVCIFRDFQKTPRKGIQPCIHETGLTQTDLPNVLRNKKRCLALFRTNRRSAK